MQSDEIGKLRTKIVKARGKLLASVEGLPPQKWEWDPGVGQVLGVIDLHDSLHRRDIIRLLRQQEQ